MNVAYLSVGSNIGERLHHLKESVRALHVSVGTTVTSISSIYETAPVGYTNQADFLNLVICVRTDLTAQELLVVCQKIERELGRVREIKWGPRTADLDILLYNNDSIETENLIVPHPRMHERAFVLIPLHDIAPLIADPMVDTSVVLWKKLNGVDEFLQEYERDSWQSENP